MPFIRGAGFRNDIARLTLTDLERQLTVHRRRYGAGGLEEVSWLS